MARITANQTLDRQHYLNSVAIGMYEACEDELHENALDMGNQDGQQSDIDLLRNEQAMTDLLIEKLTEHANRLTTDIQDAYEALGRKQ